MRCPRWGIETLGKRLENTKNGMRSVITAFLIPFSKQEASLLFQLIRLRHDVYSTILTTNIPFSKWGDVFQDSAVTAAILDRLIHHSKVFQITGNSYRMKDYKLEREQRSKKKTPDDPHWSTGEKRQSPVVFRQKPVKNNIFEPVLTPIESRLTKCPFYRIHTR